MAKKSKNSIPFGPVDLLIWTAIIVFLLLAFVTGLACILGPVIAAILASVYCSPWFLFLLLAEFITCPVGCFIVYFLFDSFIPFREDKKTKKKA
ncbi:MAG: hypothetical protein KBT06_04310 [Prevotellaceae bacterium]|nr:hypothetical protein [Candidatus Colivivens equi]